MPLEWEAESLRVSLFSSVPTRLSDEDWETLTGQTEDYNRQAVSGAGFVYTGKVKDNQLALSGISTRVNIVQSSGVPAQPESLPTMGPWEQVRDRFVDFTSAWIEGKKFPVTRIAFGAVLLYPVATRVASYEGLRDLLSSVTVDPEVMRELTYRINWPTKSSVVAGLHANRITSWSAVNIVQANLEFAPRPTATASLQGYAIRLEIDNSTDEMRSDPFDQSQVIAIYRELVSFASENAAKGERP